MAKALVIQKSGLLLCEGEDEVSFFSAWLPELGLDSVQVVAYGGKTKLASFLADLPKLVGFGNLRRLAITRDADEDADAAAKSLEGAIRRSPPVHQLSPSTMVLPGGGKPGALESLWIESLTGNPYEECVDQFFECITKKGWQQSQVFAKNDKARAQLWIATKETPNDRFGFAAWHGRKDLEKPWMKEKWVNFDHPAFAELKQFLFRTFGR